MSRNVPFFLFLLGIEMNSPLLPWIILMSLTTKQSSMMIETNAFSFSSSTGKTRTSVISMAGASLRSGNPPVSVESHASPIVLTVDRHAAHDHEPRRAQISQRPFRGDRGPEDSEYGRAASGHRSGRRPG